MLTKKCSGSERVKRNSTAYWANERARQGAFASHLEGMALPTPCFVEALDRRHCYALRASPHIAFGRSHVVALAGAGFGP